jgi:GntR family transcriptional regulator, carbon starvation induced regulator
MNRSDLKLKKTADIEKGAVKDAAAEKQSGETLASLAYQRLREDIISGAQAPGAKLRILDLCERYGIGPSPIREALNRLSRDSLVSQADHRGFSVTALSRAHLEELTKTRCWLNGLALRESITNGDDAWEEGVVLTYHRLSRIPRHVPGDDATAYNPAWEVAHRAFHRSLIAACGSRWLIGFCEQLFDAADCYRHLSRASSRKRKTPRDEHPAILEAVVARDVEKAVALLIAHFARTAELVRDQLDA